MGAPFSKEVTEAMDLIRPTIENINDAVNLVRPTVKNISNALDILIILIMYNTIILKIILVWDGCVTGGHRSGFGGGEKEDGDADLEASDRWRIHAWHFSRTPLELTKRYLEFLGG